MLTKRSSISGLLNINKPKGLTSHDVVARVRKLSNQRKVGHTGTLDPLATGVLLVCLGQATRLIEYLMSGRKQYRATIRFGITTNTLDAEGRVTAQSNISNLTETSLREVIPKFVGEIEQIPPLFSALKKDGQPLYKRARAGQTVEIAPRQVTIYDIQWGSWAPPDLTLDVTCSAGTYIRSLARDIGNAVGTGAHLAGLVRTANGPWRLAESVPLEQLEQEAHTDKSGWQKYLHPLEQAVAHLPKIMLDEVAATHVKHGRQVHVPPAEVDGNVKNRLARAYAPTGKFLAILKLERAGENIWQPKKVFQT